MQDLPSPKTAIFVQNSDKTLEPKVYLQKKLEILEQNKINALYTMTGPGDSGGGVIREGKVGDVKGAEKESRSTILATIAGGPQFDDPERSPRLGGSPNNCANQVSKLTPEQLLWIKETDRMYHNKGIFLSM